MPDLSGYKAPAVVVAIVGVIVAVVAIFVPLLSPPGGSPNPPTAAPAPPPAPVSPIPVPTTSPPVVSAVPQTPVPPVRPSPQARGTVLPYTADWTSGMDGWVGSGSWATVGGTLVNSGEEYGTKASITAPVPVSPGTDFAVTARIRQVRNSDGGKISGLASFGVVVRAGPGGDGFGAGRCIAAGIFSCGGPSGSNAVLWTARDAKVLDAVAFQPGDQEREYRVEVRGNKLAVLIDGGAVLSAVDNSNLTGTRVGLWSNRAQIEVLGFTVEQL